MKNSLKQNWKEMRIFQYPEKGGNAHKICQGANEAKPNNRNPRHIIQLNLHPLPSSRSSPQGSLSHTLSRCHQKQGATGNG